MDWLSLIVGIIKIANWLLGWAHDRGLIKQGEDKAIARAAADIFRKTEYAKKLSEKIDAMPESEVDDLLASLEPDSGNTKLPDDKGRNR